MAIYSKVKLVMRLSTAFLIVAVFILTSCIGKKDETSNGNIQGVTAIAESFGDGEKVSAVAIEYRKEIDFTSLSVQKYAVEGRKIVSTHTSPVAKKTEVSQPGRFVILTLAYENKWEAEGANLFAGPHHDEKKDGGASQGKGNGPRFDDDGKPVDLTVKVTQTGDIRATDGTSIPAWQEALTSTKATELVIQEFKKHYFTDSETGMTLPYFVYLPEGFNPESRYPLVFFIPDASADTSIETATLTQGNGATVWATPEEQAKHPCIVVAVQYPYSAVKEFGPMTMDDHEWSKGLTAVDNLLHHLIDSLPVDTRRVYGTGQSQGCMANIAISDRYPDLFAAQYLVAGQWDIAEMAAMKDKKLWILVCEGDAKAYPAMSATMDMWKSLGAKAVKGESFWNPKASPEEMDTNVQKMLNLEADIRMNVFAGGSHMYTWSLAYNIAGIRDWLFSQKLEK